MIHPNHPHLVLFKLSRSLHILTAHAHGIRFVNDRSRGNEPLLVDIVTGIYHVHYYLLIYNFTTILVAGLRLL